MGFLTGMISGTWGEVLEGMLGMAGGAAGLPPVKDMVSGARARAAGRLPLPENHDLVRGIRTAYLTALDKVTRAHAAHLGTAEASAEERAFAASARGYLDQRLSILNSGKLDFGAVDEAEVRHVLDDMVHPSATEGYAAMAEGVRQRAEAEALGELEADAGRRAPPIFRRFFDGDGVGGLGWYETYALFVNEQIKTNERFRSIFLAAELVDIKRLVEAADRRISALDSKLSRLIQDSFEAAEIRAERRHREQMEAMARQHRETLQAVAGKMQVPLPPLEAVLRRLGEADVPADAIPARLQAAAERLLALEARLSQPSNDRPETAAARARARALLDAGDLDGAEAELRDARGALRERREQTAREEATLLGDEAGIAQLRLDYAAEAELHREAARLLDFDPEAAWAAWMHVGDALHRNGSEFGHLTELRAAVTVFETEALPRAARATRPLNWAKTQNNLGNALQTLGQRGDADALTNAVCAFESALLEFTRDRAPLQWAATQNNLGIALQILGQRGNDEALARAISAYENALKERARDRAPLEWAGTQSNLGNALQTLGQRGDDEALAKAVSAFENALLECTRARAPLRWANTQNNLGVALLTLGQRGNDEALTKAVSAFESALLERTRERVPLDWAMTQNNLGSALQTLGQRGNDDALAAAISAYENALLEQTLERAPFDWAMTQNNLGVALGIFAMRGDDEALTKAVSAFENALLVYTLERAPLDWAMTKNNLGNALLVLGQHGNDDALANAVSAYDNALFERTRERAPLDWALTQENVALAEMVMGDRGGGAKLWSSALARVKAALEEFQPRSPSHTETAERLAAQLRAKLNPPG